MKLAHLTDLHLPILGKVEFKHLLNKRALGYLSWHRRRSRLHAQWAVECLVKDLRAEKCDAVLISGDLVNLALPSEFKDARSWLDRHLDGMPIAIAPGNHDAYVETDWRDTGSQLAPFMTGRRLLETGARPAASASDFPYSFSPEGCPDIEIVTANSAPPTAPGLATGALGERQIGYIETALREAGANGRFRILMLHHPIEDGVVSSRKALTDAAALRAAVARAGVELVLHGHAHVPHLGTVSTPTGQAPVLGGGSASHAFGHGLYRPARYNLLDIEKRGASWSLCVTIREMDPLTRGVVAQGRLDYLRPAAA